MTFEHLDTTGTPWAFCVDCNTVQGRIFETLLATVRNIGKAEELTLRYWANEASNRAFRSELEGVILSALSEWASKRPHAEQTEDREAPPPYYWEDF